MMAKQYIVTVEWDDEARVYVATSDDVPGLIAEAPTLDEVRDKVLALVPDLLELNAHLTPDREPHGKMIRLRVESSFRLDRAPL
jgi:predicted RNase H-like HicB family nuclease